MTLFDFLGKGIKFPFRFDRKTGGVAISEVASQDHARIRESIVQILGTRVGERFMRPDFGSRLHELVFETNDSVLKGLIRHYVIDAIRKWEKRVVITEVTFEDGPEQVDANVLQVRIHYRLIKAQVPGNMVYPFFRDLGRVSNGS